MFTGVNVHQKQTGSNEPNYVWNIWPRVIDTAAHYGFKALRCDFHPRTSDTAVPDTYQRANMIAGFCRDRGMLLTAVVICPFKSDRTDGGVFADTAAGRYQMGYTLTKKLLESMTVKPQYVELENEIMLQGTPRFEFNEGQQVSDYENTRFLEWLDLVRGEYDAVREVSPQTKIVMGTVKGSYGFIPWLLSKGIDLDVAGYHLYLRPVDDLNNWFGLGRRLQGVFESWGRPVTVNELNGHVGYGPVIMGEQGRVAIRAIRAMPTVESIYIYELFDSVAEAGFGIARLNANAPSVADEKQSVIVESKKKVGAVIVA